MKKILWIVIAALTGLLVLAGYFFQDQLNPALGLVFDWGLALLGVAGLIGIGILVAHHLMRIIHWEKGAFFSIVAVLAFLTALIGGFVLTPNSKLYRNLILNVQIPVETSLLAVLAVTLLAVSLRLIRTRGWTPMSVAFLVSAIFSLVINLGWFWLPVGSLGEAILSFFSRLPLVGARGVLLGMAIGGLVVGLRYLLALDRPGGN